MEGQHSTRSGFSNYTLDKGDLEIPKDFLNSLKIFLKSAIITPSGVLSKPGLEISLRNDHFNNLNSSPPALGGSLGEKIARFPKVPLEKELIISFDSEFQFIKDPKFKRKGLYFKPLSAEGGNLRDGPERAELGPKEPKNDPLELAAGDRYVLSLQCAIKNKNEIVALTLDVADCKRLLTFKQYIHLIFKIYSLMFDFSNVKNIYFIGFYDHFDLSVFKDYKELFENLDTINNAEVNLKDVIGFKDKNFYIRDLKLLLPAGIRSLENVGKILNVPKLEVPPGYSKSDMLKIYNERKDWFYEYGSQDVIIILAYYDRVKDYIKPSDLTIGNVAVKRLKKLLFDKGFNEEWINKHLRGYVKVRNFSGTELNLMDHLKVPYSLASLCYAGGKNESLNFGFYDGVYYAYDIISAYPSMLALKPLPNLTIEPETITGKLEKGAIDPLSWVFAQVKFKFPKGTYAPCLPVRDPKGRGLIYPLEGVSYASGLELFLSLELGAQIEVLYGFKFNHFIKNVFIDIIKDLHKEREHLKAVYGKGSIFELLIKQTANSIYGKISQGIRKKRKYTTRNGGIMQEVPPSYFTNPLIAADITASCRAVAAAFINEINDRGFNVFAYTTDGFISNIPKEELDTLNLYGLRPLLENVSLQLRGNKTFYEVKAEGSGIGIFKTRGYAAVDGQIYARAGVKTDLKANDFLDLYLNREGRIISKFLILDTPKTYMLKPLGEGELRTAKISLEYDFKRLPYRWKETTFNGIKTLWVETKPYENINEFDIIRRDLDENFKVIKTVEQLKEFISRNNLRLEIFKKGVNLRLNKSSKLNILRMILRGYRNKFFKKKRGPVIRYARKLCRILSLNIPDSKLYDLIKNSRKKAFVIDEEILKYASLIKFSPRS